MLLTFVKMSELPQLTPPTIIKSKGKSSLKDILDHRSKYIDRYFQSIRNAREYIRNKSIEHLEQITVGKWIIEGAIY
jgi:hypothetical protein